MSAQLAPRDRKRILDRLYQEKKGDWLFIVEAINEAGFAGVASIKLGLANQDDALIGAAVRQALVDYIEAELLEDALE